MTTGYKITTALVLGVIATLGMILPVEAEDKPAIAVQPMFSGTPSDLSGKQMTVVVVTVQPGASMPAHRHPGSVFAYVLEGSMQHQIDAEDEPAIYQAGQTWFEPPGARHVVFANPSDNEPARVLAVLIGDKDAELTVLDE